MLVTGTHDNDVLEPALEWRPPESALTGPDPWHPLDRAAAWLRTARTGDVVAVVVDVAVLAVFTVFILVQLSPSLLIADTTPAGGDMGAHVWGPAYLRDHLLPEFRLTGWTPDWYAGFPAYHFYMVVPALFIVALNSGLQGWGAVAVVAVAVALIAAALLPRRRIRWHVADLKLAGAAFALPFPDQAAATSARRRRRVLIVAALVLVLLGAGLPYGVAFKWVAVAGLVALPICAYAMGRLADIPFPGPPLLALGAVVFLFNREPIENGTGHIIGGNVASTMAGEFSFSISLAFAVVYLGFLLRGLKTGRHTGTCVLLLALCALSHGIPPIYAAVATVVAVAASGPWSRRRLAWLLPIPPLALAVGAFWLGPFVLRHDYLNNMGWERVPNGTQGYRDFLVPENLEWVVALASVGAVLSVILKIRLGLVLALCAGLTAVGFVHLDSIPGMPEDGILWNARVLPFLYLCLCLLAALAVGEVARAVGSLVSAEPDRPANGLTIGAVGAAAFGTWVVVGLPLGVLPFDTERGGEIEWAGLHVSSSDVDVVDSWARWNFSGYERKDAYPEYHGLIGMMQGVAANPDYGCGRAMWEYDDQVLNRYGTPMAPMLLPFWTDGCIGSMEGLYFESSVTTPYHFLMQRTLSDDCSCAQRDMPYSADQDIDLGVAQMQLLGSRYYLAFSEAMVTAASQHPALTEIATSGPWHAYLVADTELVEPLAYEPVVLTDVSRGRDWMGPASAYFQDVARHEVALAADGPDDWARVAVCETGDAKGSGAEQFDEPLERFRRFDVCGAPTRVPLPETTVSAIDAGRDRISFDVSDIGVPVVVRVSYFPNWRVDGADGPFRITPNLMVVIPTESHVELTYGWTAVDGFSYGATLLGMVAVVGLALRRRPWAAAPGLWFDGPKPVLAGFVRDEPATEPSDSREHSVASSQSDG